MARWHKRLPSLTVLSFPRVCCRCLCVSTCLVTHTHTRTHWIEPKWHNARSEQCQLHTELPSGGFTCLCVHVCVSVCVRVCGAWVWALSCATLCNIFFVICFLCVCLFFGVTRQRRLVFVLVACHTHTHTLLPACVLVLWLSVSQCLCVCVFQKMLHCFWHARRHRDSLTHAHTQACTQKHTHSHTPAYQSVEKKYMALPPLGGWLALCCCHFCCNFMATFITFICIFTSWIVFVALLLCLTWEFYERLTPFPSCSATDMHGSKMNF